MDLISVLVVIGFVCSLTSLVLSVISMVTMKVVLEGIKRDIRDECKQIMDSKVTETLTQADTNAVTIVRQAIDSLANMQNFRSPLDIANFNNFGT